MKEIRCNHINCGGILESYENPKRENAFLFKCNKCGCIFSLITVSNTIKCAKVQNKDKPKKRGRPTKVA